MHVVFVTMELFPHRRRGPAGESIAALAKAVKQLGHDVTLVSPFTDDLEDAGLVLARRLSPLELPGGGSALAYDGQLGTGIRLALLGGPATRVDALGEPGTLGAFARATVALARQWSRDRTPPDVLHLHDWEAGLVTVALRASPGSPVPTVLTVHDGTRRGDVADADLDALGVPGELRGEDGVRLDGGASILKAAVLHADVVTTVSPTYAFELRARQRTGALAETFLAREDVVGVANGIDFAVYNPATDSALPHRYDAQDAGSKGICKTAICRELELELEPSRPLVLAHLDATDDAGFDVVAGAATDLAAQGVALVVAHRGSHAAVAALRRAASRLRGTVAVVADLEDAPVRRLYAAADLTLHAPRHEPCGSSQLVAQRYGAVPIARATGGLRDTIVDCETSLQTGTGFLFDDDADLPGAVGRGIAAYRSRAWESLVRRVMSLDTSWDRPARRYVQLYERAAGLR